MDHKTCNKILKKKKKKEKRTWNVWYTNKSESAQFIYYYFFVSVFLLYTRTQYTLFLKKKKNCVLHDFIILIKIVFIKNTILFHMTKCVRIIKNYIF